MLINLLRFWREPRALFKSLVQNQAGFVVMALLLGIELFLLQPADMMRSFGLLGSQPKAALLMLWTEFTQFSLGPAIFVFCLGIMLYYALRWSGQKIDLWAATAIAGYAYIPHVVLSALGVLISHFLFSNTPPRVLVQIWLLLPLVPVLGYLVLAWRWTKTDTIHETEVDAAQTSDSTQAPAVDGKHSIWPTGLAYGIVLAGLLTALIAPPHSTAPALPLSGWKLLEREQNPAVGKLAPNFVLRDLAGKPTTHERLLGKVTLIDFWATWCTPCVAAMPGLGGLVEEFQDTDFQLLSVNEDHNVTLASKFAREQNLPFDVFMDNGRMAQNYGVQAFPTMVIVDRQGIVRHYKTGLISVAQQRESVRNVLDMPRPSDQE